MREIQVGWLVVNNTQLEAIENGSSVDPFMDIEKLSDYEKGQKVNFSSGDVVEPIPVFIRLPEETD